MSHRIHTEQSGPIPKPKRRTKAEKTPIPSEGQRQPRQTDEKYLACIRLLPSVIDGSERGIEACHIRYASPCHGKPLTGMRIKPDDKWVLPMTQAQHRRQHGMNERTFWQLEGIEPLGLCERLYETRYDVESMREIVLNWKAND